MLTVFGSMYGVAQWYIQKNANKPIVLGATFISAYADRLGVDPKQTLQAMLEPAANDGLGMNHIRLVSYWDEIESTKDRYDFSGLDWQFDMANKYGAKVSLAIGLRQPRWPECHQPAWVKAEPKAVWQTQLNSFLTAVVERYKTNPALESYQLENEFFMKIFGKCNDFDRSRLVAEAKLVKKLDPAHKLIISRSDNWIGLPVGAPTPDEFGISIYKRVWDYHFTNRYVEYPLPPWFYSFLAGAGQIVTGKGMMVHELQSEPWLPPNLSINSNTLGEQAKSINPKRLEDRINYTLATGMKTIELWGAEYWYWQKVAQNNPAYWQVVQQAISQANTHNLKLNINQLD